VADDSELTRVFTVEMLQRAGFETVEATTCDEVLKKAQLMNPDFTVMDSPMPGYVALFRLLDTITELEKL